MLTVEGLQKQYGDRPVLSNLSFAIAAGEVYGLLGPNGAGKTTTINIICGLLNADQGHIQVDNVPISKTTKPWIGIAPQENLLYRSLSCAENLNFFAQIYGLSRSERRSQVQTCLEAVNLSDRAGSPVSTLSGGMQRRLSVAIALVHRPKLLILDEPTTGLDIEARYELWTLITQLRQQGMTILLTTHMLEEAERLCQRIGILKGGQLMAEGTMADLRQRIHAAEIIVVHTSDEEGAIARAKDCGFIPRRYGSDLAFWLPESLPLKEILDRFDGLPIDSIARHPVRLEHIYLEVTQSAQTVFERIPDPWDEV